MLFQTGTLHKLINISTWSQHKHIIFSYYFLLLICTPGHGAFWTDPLGHKCHITDGTARTLYSPKTLTSVKRQK